MKLQSELHDPHRTSYGANLPHPRSVRYKCGLAGKADVGWLAEIGRVGRVERLGAELKPYLFRDLEVLVHREIKVALPGRVQDVVTRRAVAAEVGTARDIAGHAAKRLRVEPELPRGIVERS